MTASEFYNQADKQGMYLEYTCVGITQTKWDYLMKDAVRANKQVIHALLKKHGVIDDTLLIGYNPYNYYRTKTHIIFVHSSIEYFIKVNK